MQKHNKNQTKLFCGLTSTVTQAKILRPYDNHTSKLHSDTLIPVGQRGDNNEILLSDQPQELTDQRARNPVSFKEAFLC